MVNVPGDHERDAPYSYSEAGKERELEKERLRFEGDLDKWMKIIGAGIAGYQPEAYAVMDEACRELVRRRRSETEARRILEAAASLVSNRWVGWHQDYVQFKAKAEERLA